MTCQGCKLPESLAALDYAFLWPPQGHTQAKIARYLEAQDYRFETHAAESYLKVHGADSNRFIVGLIGVLSESERRDTRILMTDSEAPGLGEFGNVVTLDRMMARMRGDWLIALLSERRYTSFRQPIVSLEEGFRPVGHEYLFRGLDEAGEVISPAALFESASDPRILFNLDRAARLSAVETAAALPGREKIFINFMPGSVYDPGVCLRTTVSAIVEAGIAPERVIFEIVESERIQDLAHLRGIVNFYREAGFRIALDDYGSGFNNIDTLMMLEPDYLKLDKSLVRQMAEGGEDKRDLVEMLAERCRKNGIRTIGEGVEDGETAQLLRASGIDFAQGYYFGRPLPPDEVRARHTAADPAATAARQSARAAG
jgi:EAL domain-containing protein (putative c-di-GMP-specific phosphodiesterase class I)